MGLRGQVHIYIYNIVVKYDCARKQSRISKSALYGYKRANKFLRKIKKNTV